MALGDGWVCLGCGAPVDRKVLESGGWREAMFGGLPVSTRDPDRVTVNLPCGHDVPAFLGDSTDPAVADALADLYPMFHVDREPDSRPTSRG